MFRLSISAKRDTKSLDGSWNSLLRYETASHGFNESGSKELKGL